MQSTDTLLWRQKNMSKCFIYDKLWSSFEVSHITANMMYLVSILFWVRSSIITWYSLLTRNKQPMKRMAIWTRRISDEDKLMNTDKADELMRVQWHTISIQKSQRRSQQFVRLNILKTMRITSKKIYIKYRGKLSELWLKRVVIQAFS